MCAAFSVMGHQWAQLSKVLKRDRSEVKNIFASAARGKATVADRGNWGRCLLRAYAAAVMLLPVDDAAGRAAALGRARVEARGVQQGTDGDAAALVEAGEGGAEEGTGEEEAQLRLDEMEAGAMEEEEAEAEAGRRLSTAVHAVTAGDSLGGVALAAAVGAAVAVDGGASSSAPPRRSSSSLLSAAPDSPSSAWRREAPLGAPLPLHPMQDCTPRSSGGAAAGGFTEPPVLHLASPPASAAQPPAAAPTSLPWQIPTAIPLGLNPYFVSPYPVPAAPGFSSDPEPSPSPSPCDLGHGRERSLTPSLGSRGSVNGVLAAAPQSAAMQPMQPMQPMLAPAAAGLAPAVPPTTAAAWGLDTQACTYYSGGAAPGVAGGGGGDYYCGAAAEEGDDCFQCLVQTLLDHQQQGRRDVPANADSADAGSGSWASSWASKPAGEPMAAAAEDASSLGGGGGGGCIWPDGMSPYRYPLGLLPSAPCASNMAWAPPPQQRAEVAEADRADAPACWAEAGAEAGGMEQAETTQDAGAWAALQTSMPQQAEAPVVTLGLSVEDYGIIYGGGGAQGFW
ncbi:hypothetical protein HYH03_010177 [Edaphochlamys debaryana]|uniref:Uncharacterized protein n=1 Tax=Edaphochlamys debaryana TaxID=47281 RepID=A0A835XWB5_9CHLO|nr:hypothetical protein HYH03_010177 [Edaphochlamys debaryana]|eukprot:KAG2491386.1 hypothetical protein HYH03_010177 [Edaphochlamys debaryana]